MLLPEVGRAVRSLWRLLQSMLLVAFAATFACPAAADPLPRSLLIFDQTQANSPWGLGFRSALMVELDKTSKTPITIYSELLELGRFNSPQYQELIRTFLREKYRQRPIGVVVVHGSAA